MNKKITGSLRPRPNADDVQYYDITLELGTDPSTGKRKRLYFKVDTTDRQEAENELMIKKAEYLPIQIVQQRAGHQDPKITLAVYSHVSKDKESLVADTLGEILFVWHENLQADK